MLRVKPLRRQILGWTVILFSSLLIVSANALASVVAMLFLVIGAWILVEGDLLHPLTWFIPLYVLYGISAPLLEIMGVRELIGGQTAKVLLMQWVGGIGFIMGAGTKRYKTERNTAGVRGLIPVAYITGSVSLVLTSLYLFGVIRSGAQNKYDIALSTEPLLMLYPAFSLLLISYMILLASKLAKKKLPVTLISFVIFWNLLSVLVSGERDLLLRIIWVTVILWHVWRKSISKRFLFILGMLIIILIPILGNMKNVLLGREIQPIKTLQLEIVPLQDEFSTASSNLALLLFLEKYWKPYKYGKTLLWDVKRAVIPGTIVAWGSNPGSWFNQEFFPKVVDKGGGRGFTLVGEGYMNFGLVGVWLWLGLLGLVARWLYSLSFRNALWQIVYIASMPLCVFVTRGDFSILLSQLIKHISLPVFAISFLKIALNKTSRTSLSLSAKKEWN